MARFWLLDEERPKMFYTERRGVIYVFIDYHFRGRFSSKKDAIDAGYDIDGAIPFNANWFSKEMNDKEFDMKDSINSADWNRIVEDLERDGFVFGTDFMGLHHNEIVFRTEAGRRRAEGLIETRLIESSKGNSIILKDAADFSKKTKQGFEVIELYRDGGRLHAIFKRSGDFGIGLGYSTANGEWAQGIYNLSSIEAARETLQEEKPYARRISDAAIYAPIVDKKPVDENSVREVLFKKGYEISNVYRGGAGLEFIVRGNGAFANQAAVEILRSNGFDATTDGLKGVVVYDATRQSIIEKLRTVSVPYGERYQVTDGAGWSFDLQHHGKASYEEITKYPRVSPKESSLATLRFWYNGTFMAKFEGPINKVKADGIVYLKTQLKDSETVGEFDLDTLPSEDGEQKVKLHTGGKVIEVEVESEEHEREERLDDSAFSDVDKYVYQLKKGDNIVYNGQRHQITNINKSVVGRNVFYEIDTSTGQKFEYTSFMKIRTADSKKPFTVKDSTGRELLVYAKDSDEVVCKVRGLKDSAFTVTARTNDFPYGNNVAVIVDAGSESEAVAKYRKVLEANGDKVNSIAARPTTASDEARGIKRVKN